MKCHLAELGNCCELLVDLEAVFLDEKPKTVRWNILLFEDWGKSKTVLGEIRLETNGEGPCLATPLSSLSFAFDFPDDSSLFLLKIADKALFLALWRTLSRPCLELTFLWECFWGGGASGCMGCSSDVDLPLFRTSEIKPWLRMMAAKFLNYTSV